MKIIDIKQNTPEWLEFRKDKIGSSDFAVIAAHAGLCTNLYNKSLKSIVKDKHKPRKDSSILSDGHVIEAQIRNQIIDTYPHYWYKPVVATHSKLEYLMASFDGLYLRDTYCRVIEIKSISENRTNFEGLYSYYLAQMAHQFHVISMNDFFLVQMELYIKYPNEEKISKFTVKFENDQFILYKMINFYEGEPVAILDLSENDWKLLCSDFYNKYLKGF